MDELVDALCQPCLEDGGVTTFKYQPFSMDNRLGLHLIDQHGMDKNGVYSVETTDDGDCVFYIG
jgi:hypothetical protein